MLLLLLVALIAGAGTAVTPCVLPVLPALLSASALGGRRRPLGIVLGLALTFTIAIVALASLVKGVGLASSATRTLAIIVLIAFGVILLIPGLAQRVQAPLSRLARFGPKTRGDGFWTGMGVGAALGFVCAPCAGPILGAVIFVSSSTGPTARVTVIAISYAVGLSAVMLVYAFAGRAVLARIKRAARGEIVERALAVVLLATGVAMIFNLDTRFTELLARNTASLPGFLTDPTRALENSGAVEHRLASLRPTSTFVKRQQQADAEGVSLPMDGRAPNFKDTEDWFNTPGDKPLSITQLRGKVVIVDFWTYTCINCIRTLPFIEGLYKHYHRYGLEIIGVETPEFIFEQEAGNVRQAIKADGLTYPVVQDNRYGTWDAYQNEYWPADYFIDSTGEIRHTQFGEGDYARDEQVVRALLRAAGAKHLPGLMTAKAQTASKQLGTAETYLDPTHAEEDNEDFVEPLRRGVYAYTKPSSLGLDQWALDGTWSVGSQSITPNGASATVSGDVQARDVYLVMTSIGNKPRRGRVLIDGSPITAAERGADVGPGGYFTVTGERLYRLVRLRSDATFTITVQIPHGVQAYDFTFG
jgi:cytochrome c biogenesis protein CcdA/thiol-disulfide isomerase/thioredoxin